MAQSSTIHVLARDEGKRVLNGVMPTTFKATGAETGGGFSLVEHILPPRSLGAPPHRHRNEDEYSYILEGEIGVEIGTETILLRPGDFIAKPRGIMHAFWNPATVPARLLEVISPAGFEHYFEDLDACFPPDGPPDMERVSAVAARYGLEFDMSRLPALAAQHGLIVPGL
jgi:mannose-6-phosphate isomerase-like protein (cupin superfamily)